MAEGGVVLSNEAWALLQPVLRHVEQNGLWKPAPKPGLPNNTLPPPAYFHNDSGEEIPPYACMQVTGTEEIGGQNYLVVDQPADVDGTAGGYIFNGPTAVADDDEGKYQSAQVVRGYKNTGTVTGGDKWSPVVGEWYIAQVDGGPFICCGADDVDDDVLKVFAQGVGGGGGGTLYRFTLNADLSSGTADADILQADGTDTGTDEDVTDPLGIFSVLESGDPGWCILQDGIYRVIQAPCSGTSTIDGGSP